MPFLPKGESMAEDSEDTMLVAQTRPLTLGDTVAKAFAMVANGPSRRLAQEVKGGQQWGFVLGRSIHGS